jgi:AcrR family transcriptional regulator
MVHKRDRAAKKDTEHRRKEIARAALDLMSAHGIRGLSIAAVARRVGLTPSAIYRHYAGKDQILEAALEHVHETFLANVAAVRAETEDPLARLRVLIHRHLAFFMQNIALPRIVFSDETIASRPELRARVYRFVRDYLGAVAEIVREGQARGVLSRRVDPDTASLLFLGMVQPGGFLRLLSGGKFDVAAHLERVWPLYESLLTDARETAAGPHDGGVRPPSAARRGPRHAGRK